MEEVWKDVPGYEGLYKVSNTGKVMSLQTVGLFGKNNNGRLMTLRTDKFGYKFVFMSKDGKKKRGSVHRLVALAFIPNPDNLPQVNHKDEVRDNNNADNLEWCTVTYNNNYGNRRLKASNSISGERNGRAILTEEKVLEIRRTYIPGDKEFCKRRLAEKYGVTYETITRIVCGTLWKNLKED